MARHKYLFTLITLSLMIALLALLVGMPTPVRAAGFVVDETADDSNAHDVNPGDGVCADTWGSCTLRAAIEEANAHTGNDTITFSSAMTIIVDTAGVGSLPLLNETVTIDASNVWNTINNIPGVTIDGGGGSFTGLFLNSDSCQVYGLHITNFGGNGIYVISGMNTIGGSGAGQRNVISGNDTGIRLAGNSAQSNIVRNNYIGLTPPGNTKNPNSTGLLITDGASNNTIGPDNFISGNTSNGIMIEKSDTDDNWVGGNAIGLATDLATGLGNGSNGVLIQTDPDNTVIGGASSSGNFVAYNGGSGIYVTDAGSGTQISYNIIGSNSGDGVSIYGTTGCVISSNMIGSNTLAGVRVFGASAAGNLIWPNSISGNGGKGIYLLNGGNMSITAPTITSANQSGASGTSACPNCTIALYSDTDDEGYAYHGTATADGAGNWTYAGVLAGPNITATAIDGSGNTSEFSTPKTLNQPPNTPSNPWPGDHIVGVTRNPTLTWTGGDPDGDSVLYTVYGQENSAVVSDVWCAASASTSCTPSFQLKPNTKYLWFVQADDQHGGQVDGPFWEFTTGSGQTNYKIYLPLVRR